MVKLFPTAFVAYAAFLDFKRRKKDKEKTTLGRGEAVRQLLATDRACWISLLRRLLWQALSVSGNVVDDQRHHHNTLSSATQARERAGQARQLGVQGAGAFHDDDDTPSNTQASRIRLHSLTHRTPLPLPPQVYSTTTDDK